jgi:hypothetical protein
MKRRADAGDLPLPPAFDTSSLQVICFTARGGWVTG